MPKQVLYLTISATLLLSGDGDGKRLFRYSAKLLKYICFFFFCQANKSTLVLSIQDTKKGYKTQDFTYLCNKLERKKKRKKNIHEDLVEEF